MDVLNEARDQFDAIIIDAPPLVDLVDARVLGRCADGVILVTRTGITTRESALLACQRLTDDRIHILGAILNDWDPRSDAREYYY